MKFGDNVDGEQLLVACQLEHHYPSQRTSILHRQYIITNTTCHCICDLSMAIRLHAKDNALWGCQNIEAFYT